MIELILTILAALVPLIPMIVAAIEKSNAKKEVETDALTRRSIDELHAATDGVPNKTSL